MSPGFATRLPPVSVLQLPVCTECGHISYPPRELCERCLADALEWQAVEPGGVLQSGTTLHYSLEPFYARQLPWEIASVRLDCGPVLLAHLQPGLTPGARVEVSIRSDSEGNRYLVAYAESDPDADAAQWLKQIDFKETGR